MRRFVCETANWHVFARGARRLQLYRDQQDYSQFLTFLVYAIKASGCTLLAYALMSNHYHLVLRGSSTQLTGCMRRLNTLYSHFHNLKYGLNGHAFDGPYQAFRLPTTGILLRCIAYVLYNPVKGGLCDRPEQYPWSCSRSYLGLPGDPLSVDQSTLMTVVDEEPKLLWRWFHRAMLLESKRPERPSSGKPRMIDLHQEQFAWLLEQARESSDRLRGENPLLVAMHWARQVGVSPRAIARELGKSTTGGIRFQMCEFNKRLKACPELRAALALR